VQSVIADVLQRCPADLLFFQQHYDPTLLARLNAVVQRPFARVSYADAIVLLQTEITKKPKKWTYVPPSFLTLTPPLLLPFPICLGVALKNAF